MAAFKALKRERERSKNLLRLLAAVAVFSILMLAAISGLTAAVVQLSKEAHVKGDVMVSANDGNPVMTANNDFLLKDGVLSSRPASARRDGTCEVPGSCDATPITVTAVQV